MFHRGPDSGESLRRGPASFAFRRLRIIDLRPEGDQPMCNETGDVWIVFNGEIYNFQQLRRVLEPRHQFRSRTDTETLIHGYEEWGFEGLLRRIDGMFAFAIWDERSQELFLARDRVGKKPLFYAQPSPRELAFASTLNALLELLPARPEVDRVALDEYLVYQAVPAPQTIFAGVNALPPAHWLRFRQGQPPSQPAALLAAVVRPQAAPFRGRPARGSRQSAARCRRAGGWSRTSRSGRSSPEGWTRASSWRSCRSCARNPSRR